jgi:molybdate transport system permease protein
MASAIPVAYVFSRVPFTGKSVIRAVLYLPIALPEIVLGLSLLMFFGDNFAGRFLKAFNIDVAFTITGIITAQFFTALPYTVRIIKTSFDGIDPQLENVAQSLGYSQIRILFAVTLPLAKNGLKAAAAVAFARTIGAFGSVLILAGGIRMNTETLPITLFLNISYGNVDMAITAGIVLISVAFAGILFIEKAENTRGEHS